MSPRALLPLVVGLLPILGIAIPDDGLRPGETVRETDAVYPGAEPLDADGVPTVWPVRIVDSWTGKPIPGATVRVPNHVEGGATPEDIFDLCSGTADAEGWVRLPYGKASERRDYVVADAPGYAPNEYCDFGSKSCSLTPGVDVPAVVLDYTGMPVAGARVAVNLGCGHIPDQRVAVTDAEGRAVLRSIDPARRDPHDIWIESPRLHRGTVELSATWRPGDPPVPIHVPPGVVVEGRFLDMDGKPVKGARIGARDGDRPWVHTDEGGGFRLLGVAPGAIVDAILSDERRDIGTWFLAPPEGVFRTVRLGNRDSGTPLWVHVQGPSRAPAAGVRVVAVRESDGLTVTGNANDQGTAELSLPPGRFAVTAGGDLGAWGPARGSVEVHDGRAASVDLAVPRNPTVRIDASGAKGLTVALATALQFRELDPGEIDGKDVPVPAEGRTAFRVSCREDDELLVRFFEVPPPGPAGERPLVLEGPPVTRVTARLLGPDGKPVRGRLRLVRRRGKPDWGRREEESVPAESPVAETRLAGTLDWVAETEDAKLGRAFGTITIAKAGNPMDLGEVRLPVNSGPALRVKLPAGISTEGVNATVTMGHANFLSSGPIGEDGAVGPDLYWAGKGELVFVSVDVPGLVPRLLRIDGPPPWVAPWPETLLRVHVVDGDGKPLPDGSVDLDDPAASCRAEGGIAVLRGMPAGDHEFLVAAQEHRAKVLKLTIKEGDPREITVHLATRR